MTSESHEQPDERYLAVRHGYSFPPVGECIYCGADDDLTDEHIIPFALAGHMVLPKASCKPCAAMTSAIERKVLRGLMYEARLAGDYPSRRRKGQPETITARLLDQDGNVFEVETPRKGGPGFLTLLVLKGAAYLADMPATDGWTPKGYQQIWFGDVPVEEFVKQHGGTGIQHTTPPIDDSFVRLLAKIGYAFAVAVGGAALREHSPIPKLLTTGAGLGSWVGSKTFDLESEKEGATHALSHNPMVATKQGNASVVRIKLFASSGAPDGYEVVTHADGWREYEAAGSVVT